MSGLELFAVHLVMLDSSMDRWQPTHFNHRPAISIMALESILLADSGNSFHSPTPTDTCVKNQEASLLKNEGPLSKLLNSPADGTCTGGLECFPDVLACLVNKFSTRCRTEL